MARLTFSDEALERLEELLDADAGVYTNGTAGLPPAEREAVAARVVDDDEIAAASGATATAIRQRTSRELTKLAQLGSEER